MNRYYKALISVLLIIGIAIPAGFSQAYIVNGVCYPDQLDNCYQYNLYNNSANGINNPIPNSAQSPEAHVCASLAVVGLDCEPAPTTSTYKRQENPAQIFRFWDFSTSSNYQSPSQNTNDEPLRSESEPRKNSFGNIFGGIFGNSKSPENTILVKVPGTDDIYEIVDGQKHRIPNMDVFNDYGFSMNQIKSISKIELDKYPRASLVEADNKVYYLTESGFSRRIYTNKIIESYGKKRDEVIEISEKELTYYPKNEYVYLEGAQYKDIFQLIGKERRYVTPVAAINLNLRDAQVAPVNETELKYYKIIKPLIQ